MAAGPSGPGGHNNLSNSALAGLLILIFHLLALGVGIGGNTNFSSCIGGSAYLSVFRYQLVGIANAKLWHWGSKPTQAPNANGFASQWNIGFSVMSGYHLQWGWGGGSSEHLLHATRLDVHC